MDGGVTQGHGCRPLALDETDGVEPDVRVAYSTVRQAIGEGATELWFECSQRGVRITLGVNRVVRELTWLPSHYRTPLTKRLRAMAALDAGDVSSGQGEFWVCTGGKDYHLTLFTTPTGAGEVISIVLPV